MAGKNEVNPGSLRNRPSDPLMASPIRHPYSPSDGGQTQAIQDRRRRTLLRFQQHSINAGNHELAVKCCNEAEKRYFSILGSRAMLGISDISVLQRKPLFHHCLLACSLLITIYMNQLPCDFLMLLQILHLPPYYFWRIIGLVLRDAVGLPQSVCTHLVQVEDKILESLAWTRGSPLWEELRANEGRLPTCQQVLPSSMLNNPQNADENLADPQQPDENLAKATSRPMSKPLPQFARKVYLLMGARLKKLCHELNISDELRLKIWTLFECSLNKCAFLMEDRHLDQLLLCAIFVIIRLYNEKITFQHIKNSYRCLFNKDISKNVLISRSEGENFAAENDGPWHEERGNLNSFYNHIYRPPMRQFTLQFDPLITVDTPPASPYPETERAAPSRRRLSSSYSIFVSPYNSELTPPPTPTLCYRINSSPPECLREINNMIRTGIAPKRGRYVVQLDNVGEEGEDGPSVKRHRSAMDIRLNSLMNDRIMAVKNKK